MNDNISSARLATYVLVNDYKQLIDMACNFLDDTDEFRELVSKIDKHVRIENRMYANLTLEEINKCLDEIKDREIDNDLIARYYSKLSYNKKIKEGGIVINDGILLNAVMSEKLSIDLLKNLERMINDLDNNEKLSEHDIYMLKKNHINNKYLYFTSNTALEIYALAYNFDINIMPRIDFKDIEEKFNVNLHDSIRRNYTQYVIDSINDIKNLKSNDKYYLSYKSMTELARVEAVLPYLDEFAIKTIEDNYEFKTDTDITIRTMKKKIRKRKEELNNN